MSSINTTASLESKTIRHFFDSIAARYDFLNRFLSFKLDDYWRARSRDLILEGNEQSVLDLGTGTGKFLEIFLKKKNWNRAVAFDFSSRMLEAAKAHLPAGVEYVNGDFSALPFQPRSFDLIISAFTLRSVRQVPEFMKTNYEILTEGGKAAFLCLTRPRNFLFNLLYYPYLKIYLPLIGGLFSGNRNAYRFLADSILDFQAPETTAQMMKQAGFRTVEIHRFTFGAATLIIGKK